MTRTRFTIPWLAVLAVLAMVGGVLVAAQPAAAQPTDEPVIVSATEYGDSIEVVFDDAVVQAGDADASLAAGNFTVAVNGDEVAVTDANPASTGGTARYDLTGDWDGIDPTDEVTVTVDAAAVSWSPSVTTSSIEADVAETSTTIEPGDSGFVFAGEEVALGATTGETFQMENDSDLVRGGQLGDNQTTFAFDTDREDIRTGKRYDVTWGTSSVASFKVYSLGLEASMQTVTSEENLTVDLRANQGGRPMMIELVQDGSVQETVNVTLSYTSGAATADFGTVSVGTYTARVVDQQTGIETETRTIDVPKGTPETIQFEGDGVFEDQRGDVVDVPIRFTGGVHEGTVVVGSQDTDYWIHATVTDGGDGEVTLQFDSYAAGTHDDGNTVLSVADVEDEVTVVDEGGDFTTHTSSPSAATLDATVYQTNATMGHATDLGYDADAVGGLALQGVGQPWVNVGTTAEEFSPGDWNVSEVRARADQTIVQSDVVAADDHLALVVSAPGTESRLDDAAAGADASPLLTGDGPVRLTVSATVPGADGETERWRLGPSNATVIPDAANDTYFVLVDTGAVTTTDGSPTVDTEYRVALSRQDLDGDRTTVNETFAMVERTATLDTAADGHLYASPDGDATISGRTTAAPGTTLQFRVLSRDPATPFVRRPTATVASNWSFSTELNLADAPNGTTFDVEQMEGDVALAGEPVPGTVGPAPEYPTLSTGVVPRDVDRDGVHEDLNGNDRFDSDDVVVYFEQKGTPAMAENPALFDLNGNDRVDFDDVVALFGQL